jgi:hypothetical protein
MYKNKDGKVIASLTEVKNKTGDIFAIVDEFGEIALTSYNKVRYKIIKVDIENSVEIAADGPEAKVATTQKKRLVTPKLEEREEEEIVNEVPAEDPIEEVIEDIQELPAKEEPVVEIESEPEVELKPNALFDKLVDVQIWDRDGRIEKEFSINATKPLIN